MAFDAAGDARPARLEIRTRNPDLRIRSILVVVFVCLLGLVIREVAENQHMANVDSNVRKNGAFSAVGGRTVVIDLEARKTDISQLAPLLQGYNRTRRVVVQAPWVSDSELIALVGISSVVELRIFRKHVSRDILSAICERLNFLESVALKVSTIEPGSEPLIAKIKARSRNEVTQLAEWPFETTPP